MLNDVISVNCHNVDIIILQWLVPGWPGSPGAILCRMPGWAGSGQPGPVSSPGCAPARPGQAANSDYESSIPAFFLQFTHFSASLTMCLSQSLLAPATRPAGSTGRTAEKFALWQFAQNLAQNCNFASPDFVTQILLCGSISDVLSVHILLLACDQLFSINNCWFERRQMICAPRWPGWERSGVIVTILRSIISKYQLSLSSGLLGSISRLASPYLYSL